MPKNVDDQMREATRQRILRVAVSEFARLGFDQANINVIAEQAGIGKGTIYLYFATKRDLFLEMSRFIAQAQLTVIRTALAAKGTTVFSRKMRCGQPLPTWPTPSSVCDGSTSGEKAPPPVPPIPRNARPGTRT